MPHVESGTGNPLKQAPDGARHERHDAAASLDDYVTSVIGPVGIALGVMYVTSVINRALSPTLTASTAPTAIVLALGFLGVGGLALRRPVPAPLAHPLILVSLGILTIESLGRGAAVAGPNLQLALIGAGAIVVRPRWLIGAVAAVAIPWAIVVVGAPGSSWAQAGPSYALDLATATLLGVTVFVGRRRALVALERARREAHDASTRDPLTGLLNRRGIEIAGTALLDHTRRTGEPLAVLMVDLDGFKAINDGLGHAEGDRALVTAANLMQATLRASDLLGRLGGDEFVIIAGTGIGHAALVDRLRDALRNWRDDLDRYRLEPTIGMVVAGHRDDRSVWQLVDEADQLLYAQRGTLRGGDAGAQGWEVAAGDPR